MSNLLSIQPAICRQPFVFPLRDTSKLTGFAKSRGERLNRLSGFDPSHLYVNASELLDPYKRIQSGLYVSAVFPKIEGKCACGCDKPVKYFGKEKKDHRRYATENCNLFVNLAFEIIYGKTRTIGKVLAWAQGNEWTCQQNGPACESPHTAYFEVDHIIGVKQGGGASWLSNFRILCHPCHVDKTNRDFRRGKYAPDQLFNPDNL